MQRLLKIIESIDPIKKTKDNPFFKSKYFDINQLLEVLKPIFKKEGLVLSQPLTNIEGRPAIATQVIDIKTGSLIFAQAITLPDLQDPQKMGSAITYYRRFSLKSLLEIEEEDDDGAGWKKPDKKTETKKEATSIIDIIAKIKNTKTKQQVATWINWVAKSELSTQQKNVLSRAIEEVSKTVK